MILSSFSVSTRSFGTVVASTRKTPSVVWSASGSGLRRMNWSPAIMSVASWSSGEPSNSMEAGFQVCSVVSISYGTPVVRRRHAPVELDRSSEVGYSGLFLAFRVGAPTLQITVWAVRIEPDGCCVSGDRFLWLTEFYVPIAPLDEVRGSDRKTKQPLQRCQSSDIPRHSIIVL